MLWRCGYSNKTSLALLGSTVKSYYLFLSIFTKWSLETLSNFNSATFGNFRLVNDVMTQILDSHKILTSFLTLRNTSSFCVSYRWPKMSCLFKQMTFHGEQHVWQEVVLILPRKSWLTFAWNGSSFRSVFGCDLCRKLSLLLWLCGLWFVLQSVSVLQELNFDENCLLVVSSLRFDHVLHSFDTWN